LRVIFSPRARRRLREIHRHIAKDNPGAAIRSVDRIVYVAGFLADHPRLGRDYDGRTRALMVSGLPYRIHYSLDEAAGIVEIITVAHTSQGPPRFRRG
jgi:plasmid stabilization system protein ParE